MAKIAGEHEEGVAVLELLLALPVVAMILVGVVFGVTSAARSYLELRAQVEVRQEVQQAMARILEDCLSATAVKRSSGAESLRIYKGQSAVKDYFVNEDSHHLRKLVENRVQYPMTGNHVWAQVAVTAFGYSEVDPVRKPGLYRVWLEAKSTRYGSKPYRLAAEFYLPPERPGAGT
jgi:Tfp pilus assembly protein PilV